MSELKNNLARRALSAGKYTIVFRLISQVVGVAATVFLVRTLSEQDYGIYNLLYSVIALLGMVFSLGIANTLQRYIPEYYSRGEFVLADRLYRFASLIRLLSNVAVLAVVLICWDYVGPLLKITAYRNYFLFFTLVILLHMQRGILQTCLNSYFLQKQSQGIAIIFALIKGIGYGAALFFHWNLWFVLVIDLLAYLVVFLLLQLAYWQKIPRQGGQYVHFPREDKKRLMRYALFYNFNDAGVGMLAANFDNFIIVMFLDPVAVGAYAFCNRLNNMAARMLPVNYLLAVIQPLFFSGNNDSQPEQIRRNFQLLIKTTYIFYFPLFVFFLLLSKELIMVFFGGKFVEYYPVLIGVAFCGLVNAVQLPLGLVAQLRERADIVLYSKFFAAYNLLADIAFIRYLGIWGAVLATGTAVFGKNLYIWFFIRQEASLVGMGQFFFRMTGGWLLVAGIWYAVSFFIMSEYLRLAAGIAAIILGLMVQFRFVHFNQVEKEMLQNMADSHKKVRALLKWSGLSAAIVER